MTGNRGASRSKKVLTSAKPKSITSNEKVGDDRYNIKNAGPCVQKAADKLVGKAISQAPLRTLSLAIASTTNRPETDRKYF
jgi:hypothetical protein